MAELITEAENLDQINRLVPVPEKLYTDDGREILVQGWGFSVDMKRVASVDIKGIILISEDQSDV